MAPVPGEVMAIFWGLAEGVDPAGGSQPSLSTAGWKLAAGRSVGPVPPWGHRCSACRKSAAGFRFLAFTPAGGFRVAACLSSL